METIKVLVDWCDHNYSAYISEKIDGVVIVTGKTIEELKQNIQESLTFHIEGLEEEVDEWLAKGDYQLTYECTVSATLQNCLNYTTLAALSRVTGIKHAQLSHYANSIAKPKPKQKEKILLGLHTIGEACLAAR